MPCCFRRTPDLSDPLGPNDQAPAVTVIDGEVVIIGKWVGVTYTLAAARELRDRLDRALRAGTARESD